MAILRSNGVLIVDALPDHEPQNNEAVFAFDPATLKLYAYQGSLPWVEISTEVTDDGTKYYEAYWSQSTTDDPVETASTTNDFGSFVLDRPSMGVYTATLAGAFPDLNKFFPTMLVTQSSGKPLMFSLRRTSADEITLETYAQDGSAVDIEGRIAIGFKQLP
jgi:hypothetical protein